jgi:hypothetical protein
MIILDSEGVSRLIRRDRAMMALAKGRAEQGETLGVSAATLVEGVDPGKNPGAVRWALSGLKTVEVARGVALTATALLREAGRHGHSHALDAIVCATAVLADEPPVTILTSDPADLAKLLAGRAEIGVMRLD